MKGPLTRLDTLDRRLFRALTRRERAAMDRGLKTLSTTANQSVLWLSIATVLAVAGGDRGRRAALRGILAISMTSTLVNLPLKYLARRQRPERRRGDRPPAVPIPASFSFPSGHSASAFAFTTAVAREDPRLLLLLLPLASTVAYSRVHLRVHYPFDVLAGATIGTGMGLTSNALIRVAREWRDARTPAPLPQRPPTNRVIVVSSPHAGRAGKKHNRARAALKAAGLEIVEELTVEEISRLPQLLKDGDGTLPLVIAAGGDGTVGAVSNYVVGTRAIMGVLPLGTSNDFARSLNLPMGIENAARLLSIGRVSTIDAGRLVRAGQPSTYFVHAATAGLNVNFARLATRADLRHRLGRLTYAVAGILALKDRPVFECAIDDGRGVENLRLEQLSIINTPVFGGVLGLRVPRSSPDDRRLEVLLVEHLPIRRLVRSALLTILGRRGPIRGVRIEHAARMVVRPKQSMPIALDGEVCGEIPGTFEVVPDGLQVITPSNFEDLENA
ncbi:MAG TPA: phosphatase PAP2 family protein [Candidatus Dormibacteraeota bacterium]